MTKISVLIVDDDPVVRQMLPTYFADEEFAVAGVVASGREALELLSPISVDVVLCDVRMPEISGMALAREIKARAPHLPVVGVTSFDDDECVVEMLRAGAAGLVLKAATPEAIKEAVRTAVAGNAYVDPAMAGKLGKYLNPVDTVATEAVPVEPPLTPREKEVLDLLLEGQSNQEIADELHVSIAAVKKNVAALFAKYGVTSRLKLVIAAMRGF